jgi:1-acyl-sn-glycerol-3-phosphate acyltransferase
MMTTDGGPGSSQTLGDFTGDWDPTFVRRFVAMIGPLAKGWFRSEVHGLERIPAGGSLVVGNHSGGIFTMDIPIFATAFFEHFGYDRRLYSLGHDVLFRGPQAEVLMRIGLLRANRDNAGQALKSGAALIVFPGGDYDAYRPTSSANVIDFGGRTGYVKTALEAGVSIVPIVSIGGQENQIYLTRGRWLARRLGLKRLLRLDALPITFGVPFGASLLVLPLNLPLPTKIVTEVLTPIDIVKTFGRDPDPSEVDAHVRDVMQAALTGLAAERRLPVLG